MGNVVKANFKKKEAVVMTCTACGAAGVAGCECGVAYMPATLRRAKEAIAETPDHSNVKIAERIGVGEATVRRARKITSSPTDEVTTKRIGRDGVPRAVGERKSVEKAIKKSVPDAAPRKPPKPPKIDMNVIKQAGAFHTELTNYTQEFCTRIKEWHAAHQVDEESHYCVVQALEMASMRLQQAAQDIDDR